MSTIPRPEGFTGDERRRNNGDERRRNNAVSEGEDEPLRVHHERVQTSAPIPATRSRSRRREESFVEFYTASFARVLRAAALFCGHIEIARDAAQEAFVRAFERWGRLEAAPWREGWVMTTAFNACRRSLRRRDRREPATRPSISSETNSIARLDLAAALARLPLRQRQALVLFYYGDQTIDDVARVLGLSTGSVKTHLARGRKALAALLGDTEVGHGS